MEVSKFHTSTGQYKASVYKAATVRDFFAFQLTLSYDFLQLEVSITYRNCDIILHIMYRGNTYVIFIYQCSV